MTAAIVNDRIEGTRITVFDVYYYLETGHWTHKEIADILRISAEQLQVAIRYIEEHKEEVLEVHRQVEERNRRGNPPELQAKLDASHAKFMEMVREMRRKKAEAKKRARNRARQ